MAVIVRGRRELFDARAARPRPHLDDKVLTAWNGLMIAACARAARAFEGEMTADDRDARSHYLTLATRAAAFVRRHLWDATRGIVLRRERAGQAGIDGFAEDYACLVWGLLELFQTTGAADWLEWAIRLQEVQDGLFRDAAGGGWFSTSGRDPSVLLRMKEDYDGAEPSATSVSVQNLLVLAHLTGRDDWRANAEQALARLGARAGDLARQMPLMLANIATWHAGVQQIVVVGHQHADDTRALRRVIAAQYLPFAVQIPVEPGEERSPLSALLPWLAGMVMRDGRATAYVCRNFTCELPVTDPEELRALLRQP